MIIEVETCIEHGQRFLKMRSAHGQMIQISDCFKCLAADWTFFSLSSVWCKWNWIFLIYSSQMHSSSCEHTAYRPSIRLKGDILKCGFQHLRNKLEINETGLLNVHCLHFQAVLNNIWGVTRFRYESRKLTTKDCAYDTGLPTEVWYQN